MTRNKIEYDLYISPFSYKLNETIFYFSSFNHLEKFKECINENRKALTLSLSNRFKVKSNFHLLFDLVLYSKIETRGFLVKLEGVEYTCLNDIILGGEKVTNQD